MTFQVPAPDPNIIIPQVIRVFGMMMGMIVVGVVALGPIGKAIGAAIRHWLGGGRETDVPPAALEDLRDEVRVLRGQLAELAERQDFSERLLAQVRKERALPAGGQGGAVDV